VKRSGALDVYRAGKSLTKGIQEPILKSGLAQAFR
jgi:hypothetical protein